MTETTTTTTPTPEVFEQVCYYCIPFFCLGPGHPDCRRCHGHGRYTSTYHEVTYRVVTTTVYECTANVDLGDTSHLHAHLLNYETWGDPAPPPVDGDITELQIRVDGEWRPVNRDYRRQPDGQYGMVMELNGHQVPEGDTDATDQMIADALRADLSRPRAAGSE